MLYVVDSAGVQSVGPEGAVQTVISPRLRPTPEGPSIDISIGGTIVAFDPDAIAISATGDIYVANFSPKLILQFPPGGPPSFVGLESLETGIYAVSAGLAAAPDGSIVLADYGNFAVDRLAGSSVSVVKAFSFGGVTGIHGILRPSGVAVASNGEIYADTDGLSGGSNNTALIAIDPNGDVHVLDIGLPANR
jgi:DNA-binding beta-propeller fold protein YncE